MFVLKDEEVEVNTEVWLMKEGRKIHLMCRGPDRHEFYIATLRDDGLMLHNRIAEKSGCPVDKDGRIKLV